MYLLLQYLIILLLIFLINQFKFKGSSLNVNSLGYPKFKGYYKGLEIQGSQIFKMGYVENYPYLVFNHVLLKLQLI